MGNVHTKESPTRFRAPDQSKRQTNRQKHREHRRRQRETDYHVKRDPLELVDGGYLFPIGVYSTEPDYKGSLVRNLIISRRLAPFYKGLDSYDANWSDRELLEAVGPPPTETPELLLSQALDSLGLGQSPQQSPQPEVSHAPETSQSPQPQPQPPQQQIPQQAESEAAKQNEPNDPNDPLSEQEQQTVWLYRNIHECPICLLLYPRLNVMQCCRQPICSECFVQVKRAPPHPPHEEPQPTHVPPHDPHQESLLVSEPARCPFCKRSEMGVIFEAPPFRWGLPEPKEASPNVVPVGHQVTTDLIRPSWESALQSARRKVARKSAAAHALHQTALLAPDGSELTPRTESRRRFTTGSASGSREREIREILHSYGSRISELEQSMLDHAIEQSLIEK